MALPSFVCFIYTFESEGFRETFYKNLGLIGSKLSYEFQEEATSENTRFAVERAESGNGLVHLRHAFTNKYLARRGVDEPTYIKAETKEKEENQSVAGCTLFRPQIINENTVSLVHVQSGLGVYVKHVPANKNGRSYWVLANEPGSVALETQYLNLETLVILPKRIVIKGDNGKYLGNSRVEFAFFEFDDAADPRAQFEVVMHRRGFTTFKSLFNNRFCFTFQQWSDDATLAFRASDNFPFECWYTPINGPNNTICIRNEYGMFANNFLERDITSHLCRAIAPSMMPRTRFIIEEPVVVRMVWVDFQLDNGRIFNARPLLAATATTRNESDFEHNSELDVSHTKTTTSTWDNNIHVMLGIRTTFTTGIPFVAMARIEATAEFEFQHQWGGSRETSESVAKRETVTIPPWHMANVSVLATEGQCNIPFSYRQRDQLLSGEFREIVLHDGVYDNVNSYDFHTIIRIIPIDRTPLNSDNVEPKESPFPYSKDEYESLLEIYKSKVAAARAGKLDNLESTPTIIYEKAKIGKPENEELKTQDLPKTE